MNSPIKYGKPEAIKKYREDFNKMIRRKPSPELVKEINEIFEDRVKREKEDKVAAKDQELP